MKQHFYEVHQLVDFVFQILLNKAPMFDPHQAHANLNL